MKKYLSIVLALVMAISVSASTLYVEAAETEEIQITGLYKNPNTGIIEDSGGENSFALGQSMVENMMSTVAILEEDSDGGYYLTFDFNLYNFISDIELQSQSEGETTYTDITHEVVEEQEETVTLKVPVEDMDSLLRASCFVIPMGRSVVFYITYSDTFDAGVEMPSDTVVDTATDVMEVVGVEAESVSTESASNEVQGITLSSGLTSSDTEGEDDSTLSTSGEDIDVMIDGSFWVLLFVLIFCTNIISGVLLIAGYHFVKSNVLAKKSEEDILDEELEEEDAFVEMDFMEFEVNDEENI